MKLTSKGISTTAFAVLLLSGSCANESPWSSGTDEAGRISLQVATDGAVRKSTRANDEVSPVIPSPDQFSISLVNTDQSYSKTWSSPDAFNREGGFPMGSYTLSVISGNIEEEGFSNSCFQGETALGVRLGEETSATVTATLANSMVSIRYTDEFKAMFPNYSAMLTSEGHVSPVVLTQSETRPAYMSPRQIRFSLSLTNQQGKEVTVVPAIFTALPQHHYVVIVGVEEKVGGSTLDVSFEENVVTESTEILLTDELFTTPAPAVTVNEDAASAISAYESLPIEGKNPELHVMAFGGISKATLTFSAEEGGTLPLTSTDYDLVNMSEATSALLKEAGIECMGFSSKGDVENKMAVVNLKNFTKSLTQGKYKASLTVEDKLGRISDIDANPVVEIIVDNLKLAADKSVAPKYLGNTVEVAVASNCGYLGNNLTFNLDGREAKISALKSQASAPGDKPYSYIYTLEYPVKGGITDSGCNVELSLNGKKQAELLLNVDMPQFAIERDAFANKVLVRLQHEDAALLKHIVENVAVYSGSSKLPESRLVRTSSSGIIEIRDLNPSKEYSDLSLTLGSSQERNSTAIATFTTEAAAGVPNGDFEDLTETINTTVQQGGRWSITDTKSSRFTTTLSMVVKEPNSWLSTNPTTCNLNASNKNSWYVVPSVYNSGLVWLSHQPTAKILGIGQSAYDSTAEIYKGIGSQSHNNAMVIRNVAWDHAGSAIDDNQQTGNTDFSNYYCSKEPASIANRTPGRMWLGIAGQEGAAFSSRPTKLKGFYQFKQDSQDTNERGVVEIQILSGEKIIGSAKKELVACSGYTEFELPIEYVAISELFNSKATSLRISFLSSNKTSDIKTTNYCNKEECVSRGAMLIVDNLSFVY